MFSKYEKYALTSPNRIVSLNDLKIYGLHNLYIDPKNEYIFLPYINNMEKKTINSNDWKYKINKYNFRESWDFETEKKKIGFFGCSFTFGEGVEYENTFAYLVANQNNLNPFNFGIGGSSIHRITRIFSIVTKLIKLDYAVFTLPHWQRQMYLKPNGEIINLIPHWPHFDFSKISQKLTELDEDYYIIQTVSFLAWIYDLAIANKIKIILSSWDNELHKLCETIYPDLTIDTFQNIENDKARDNSHPGIKSHKNYADKINKKLDTVDIFQVDTHFS